VSSVKFAELSAGTCLSCGLRTLAAVCPRCDSETGIADQRNVAAGSIQVGYLGRGSRSTPTVWLTTETDSTQYTASGRVVPVEGSGQKGFVAVAGVDAFRCEVAAALAACADPACAGFGGQGIEQNIVAHRLSPPPGSDGSAAYTARVRRTACELAGGGRVAPLQLLPLSPTEIRWWSALAALRANDRDEVVAHLGELPSAGYDVALIVLRWASERWVGDAAARARFLVERRLQGTPSQRLAKVSLASGSSPIEQFLLDPDAATTLELERRPDVSKNIALALAASGVSIHGKVEPPASVPLAILDDLIDLNVPIDPASLGDDMRRHMLARTHPEALTDDEVAALDFLYERDRRRVVAGAFGEIEQLNADPHIRAIVRLHADSVVGPELRALDPALCEQLDAFLAKPSVATLTVGLVRDPSLWPLLARRLDIPVSSWPADPGSPRQAFVGWIALRATFARLTSGDWAGAVDAGEHAQRLAADDAQRREAANAVAFALWQLGDPEAAGVALRSVSSVVVSRDSLAAGHLSDVDIALTINQLIVAGSADGDAASASLAKMIVHGGASDIAGAAVMASLRHGDVDALPWTARPHRVPDELLLAWRAYVVRSEDAGVVRALLRQMSNLDREWVSRASNFAQSSLRSAVDVRVFQACATGAREYVDALTYALRSSNPAAWLFAERDRAVEIAVREVFKDDGSSALFALFALERSMPLTADQTAALSLLAVFAACAQAEADGAPLDEGFRTLLEDADALYQLAPPSMHLRHLLVAAWERMAGHSCARFTRQIAKMARACDNIVEQTARQGRRRNQELAELAVMPIMRDAEELAEVIDEFRAHVVSTPVVAELDALSASLVDIQRQAANIRRGRY
jgi:hypothetical protein